MAYLTTQSATQNLYFSIISGGLDALGQRIKRRRLFRQTFNELSALSTRDLADLGLTRADIRRVAMEAANQSDI